MDIVLKISTDYTASTTIAQIMNPQSVEYTEELMGSGTLNFKLNIDDPAISSIIEFKKVALYAIENGEDRFLWSGYIDEIRNDFNFAYIRCGDEKDFLRNKMILGNKDFNLIPINSVIDTLVTEANSRKGPFEPSLTYSTSLVNNTGKRFNAGTSYFDIISEICAAFNHEWTVRFNKIYVEEKIGTDRTLLDENFFSFYWNKNSPNENSVYSFQNKRSGRDIVTHILAKSGNDIVILAGDKLTYGSIERSVAMDPGILSTQAQQYLDNHQISQFESEFNANVSSIDGQRLQVGDTVGVKIIYGNALVDTEASLRVIQKNFRFANKSPIVSFKFSNYAKGIKNMSNFLASLDKRIKRFELN